MFPFDPTKMHFYNLMKLITCLRDVESNGLPFDMEYYVISGEYPIPGCALAHYFARRDLQNQFSLWELMTENGESRGMLPLHLKIRVYAHFGIDVDEQADLFSGSGSGGASTAGAVADYIEHAISRWYPTYYQCHQSQMKKVA